MTPDPDSTRSGLPPAATRDQEQLDQATRTTGPPLPDPRPGPPGCPPASAGRYHLAAEIARGGMGVVYRATDRVLCRDVAVKVLGDQYTPDCPAARRFVTEARVSGRLDHPNIPPIHDLGTLPDGRPFLAMKLVRGRTLADLLADRDQPHGPAGRTRLLFVFQQVCQAVAFAHEKGVIHRDLKPHNVMVGAFDEVQVMDWGLAKELAAEPVILDAPADPLADLPPAAPADHTQSGAVLGTPAFMAPEQARGTEVDERADVFGLGAVLCAILTGKPPFVGADARSTLNLAARGDLGPALVRLKMCDADREVLDLARRCLAADPHKRPRDAGVVAAAVAEYTATMVQRVERAQADAARADARATRRLWWSRAMLVLAIGGAVAAQLAVALAQAAWTGNRGP